jgi:glutaredoxin
VLREDGFSERAIFIVDPHGVISYVDIHDINDQPDNEVLFAELERLLPQDSIRAGNIERPSAPELPSGGVVMYCTPWCRDCTVAKEWLNQRGIPFREVNISINPEGVRRVRQWTSGHLVTPTFDIDGVIVVDFDEKRLAEVLGVA